MVNVARKESDSLKDSESTISVLHTRRQTSDTRLKDTAQKSQTFLPEDRNKLQLLASTVPWFVYLWK